MHFGVEEPEIDSLRRADHVPARKKPADVC